ncbi:hypothetical protein Tcan_05784 [Toxocara canis]|uniref:Uncharacterized protein n=1 Tax=Toxocara canis TaxID=6265 RepID=A0A0B2VZV4_TOXCA|nr:hypothetical protein Tcan_05784 [Toxocara canis]
MRRVDASACSYAMETCTNGTLAVAVHCDDVQLIYSAATGQERASENTNGEIQVPDVFLEKCDAQINSAKTTINKSEKRHKCKFQSMAMRFRHLLNENNF